MGDVIQFRPRETSIEPEMTDFVLGGSISEFAAYAIKNKLILSCTGVNTSGKGDETKDSQDYEIYQIVLELPDGRKTQIMQTSDETKSFLGGLCLGVHLIEKRDFVSF